MDGNGRWASKRFMPRLWGHKKGVDALVNTLIACGDRGIEHLTVFAFSSENWRRPTEEVSGLMNLVPIAVSSYLHKLAKLGVRIRVIGDRQGISPKLCEAWDHAETLTRDNTRITVNIAFNYGGRWDVVRACQQAMKEGVSAQDLDEATLARHMCLHDCLWPDFDEVQLDAALASFARRDRRFGGVKPLPTPVETGAY
jgi:undecaprenyl diphosphate synthase